MYQAKQSKAQAGVQDVRPNSTQISSDLRAKEGTFSHACDETITVPPTSNPREIQITVIGHSDDSDYENDSVAWKDTMIADADEKNESCDDEAEAEILSTMVHKWNVGLESGCGRRGKTIFSVDAPKSKSQVESKGRGEGDQDFVGEEERDKVSEMEFVAPAAPRKCQNLKAKFGGNDIQILPQTTFSDSLAGGDASCSRFPLVLQRSLRTYGDGEEFERSVWISNRTSSLHAYKIDVHSSVPSQISVKPSSTGLIAPNAKTFIEIRAKDCSSLSRIRALSKSQIEIKVFSPPCRDESRLSEYYDKLKKLRPDEIASHRFGRIILWDSGEIAQAAEFEERKWPGKDLTSYQLGQYPKEKSGRAVPQLPSRCPSTGPTTFDCVRYLKNQLIISQQNLVELNGELKRVETVQYWQTLAVILIWLVHLLWAAFFSSSLPVENDKRSDEKSLPATYSTSFLSFFGFH